jgi:hypothetical protein
MVALVAMAAFLAVTMFGGAVRDLFQNARPGACRPARLPWAGRRVS